ncbi:rRNA-processing protein FCF1 [Aspergillus fumigatus Z5]|nr:rRNA-processing protein FCF1 [Aspergillus fumigatus Z5]
MSERLSRPSSPYLEPPRRSTELEDSGAQDSVNAVSSAVPNSDDEHFSDASEGHERSRSHPLSGRTSPIPLTRVERVDDRPAHGEVPGTVAYEKREQDAVPDEIEIIPTGSHSRSSSTVGSQNRPLTPGGSPIPRTIVEKVDVNQPSHGDVPGTLAYEKRRADAVPDLVIKASEPDIDSPAGDAESNEPGSVTGMQVPATVASQVDSTAIEDSTYNLQAHRRRPSDAAPDVIEKISDAPDLPDSLPTNSSAHPDHTSLRGSLTSQSLIRDSVEDDRDYEDNATPETPQDHAAADDFDDFAEEQDLADGDFGDFDDGFQEPDGETAEPELIEPQQPLPHPLAPPIIDFDTFQSFPDLHAALDQYLDKLYPTSKNVESLPPLEPIQDASSIFSTERSLSLWSQLVAPPPLQPQNWVKSRIRRLFLVSLGVPVDLDEILPASKQKKLVLPSINLSGSDTTGSAVHSRSHSQARKSGSQDGIDSPTTSAPTGRHRTSRRRDRSPPPQLDLSAVRRLCATTDAALDGLTDAELRTHVKELEQVTLRASSVLEYWLKRRDGLVSEREAFEGVIENLVNHARRVRNRQINSHNLQRAIEALHQDGVVIVQNAIPPFYLDQLNTLMTPDAYTLYEKRSTHRNFGPETGNIQQEVPVQKAIDRFREQIPDVEDGEPKAHDPLSMIIANPFATAIIECMLGPKPQLQFLSANTAFRTKEAGRQPPHIDVAFDFPRVPFGFCVNVNLVGTTATNGATELWPGTHTDTDVSVLMPDNDGVIRKELVEARRNLCPPVKRAISQRDNRVKQPLNGKKEEKKPQGEELVRHIPVAPSNMFFAANTALGPPYTVLVDTNFVSHTIRAKLDMLPAMMDLLYAKCIPTFTDCTIAELEKLGPKFRLALRVAKDPRWNRLHCDHAGTYADDCIVDRVMKHRIYTVATNDKDLVRRIRKIPGVPIMKVARGKYVIERLPDSFD